MISTSNPVAVYLTLRIRELICLKNDSYSIASVLSRRFLLEMKQPMIEYDLSDT